MNHPTDRQIKLMELKECIEGNQDIAKIYELNNHFMPDQRETSMGCGSCQTRVRERVIGFYNHPDIQAELKEIYPPKPIKFIGKEQCTCGEFVGTCTCNAPENE